MFTRQKIHFQKQKVCRGIYRKDRITVTVGANMCGTGKLKLLVIGKLKFRASLGVVFLSVIYRSSKNARMRSEIYEELLLI